MDADSSDEEDEDFDLGGAEAAQQAADEEASDSDDDSDEEEEVGGSPVRLQGFPCVNPKLHCIVSKTHRPGGLVQSFFVPLPDKWFGGPHVDKKLDCNLILHVYEKTYVE